MVIKVRLSEYSAGNPEASAPVLDPIHSVINSK
jgi:hypothetical protein